MLCAKCNYDNPADALLLHEVRHQYRESLLFLRHGKSR
jgi:hypothetical protein